MFQGKKIKIKSNFILFFMFSKKIQSPSSLDVGWWLYRIAVPLPPRRSRRARWLLRGGRGIVVFQENKIK
jgi:hypothetical protein